MASSLPRSLPRLHRAAARGEEGKVHQYLNAGDDVNARDADGRTALLWTVHNCHINCVEILLAAGANASISGQESPLYAAAQSGNTAIARALIEAKANVNALINRPGAGTALCVAAYRGDQAMVKLLLVAGCDTSIAAVDGQHPLTIASLKGHTDVITLLLDAGADVSAMSADGVTALTAGVHKRSRDVITLLLERGADVNQASQDGATALHRTAYKGFDELIDVLIAACADVEALDMRGRTPLHVSAYCGHSKCAWVLLRAGANVSALDFYGASHLHIAAAKGFTDVIEVLLSGGGQAGVNIEDCENQTPLALASRFADAKAVNLLLDAGADVNQANALGRTALYAPVDVKIVKALLDRGANAKVLDKYGATVLHSAGSRGASTAVICALFKGEADPTVKERWGETAADYARAKGHDDAVKLLDLLAAKHRSTNRT